jgi:Domain of unknown function (DUF5710)
MQEAASVRSLDMKRTYLYVSYEERDEVEALGARWDDDSKCFYIEQENTDAFRRWLPPDPAQSSSVETEYYIVSDHAEVVAANIACQGCLWGIEVICIYCEKGLISGEECKTFRVSNITAIDEALARQLRQWPNFRFEPGEQPDSECFANHCPHCSMQQDEYWLHCEPDGAFFMIKEGPASLRFTPLDGVIRLSGVEIVEL